MRKTAMHHFLVCSLAGLLIGIPYALAFHFAPFLFPWVVAITVATLAYNVMTLTRA